MSSKAKSISGDSHFKILSAFDLHVWRVLSIYCCTVVHPKAAVWVGGRTQRGYMTPTPSWLLNCLYCMYVVHGMTCLGCIYLPLYPSKARLHLLFWYYFVLSRGSRQQQSPLHFRCEAGYALHTLLPVADRGAFTSHTHTHTAHTPSTIIHNDRSWTAQSTHIYRVPQCMFPRRNRDSPTPSHASECAPPPGTNEAWHTRGVRGWGSPNSPIPTTGENAWHSAYSVMDAVQCSVKWSVPTSHATGW